MTSSDSTVTPEDLAAIRLAVENSDLTDYCIAFIEENGQLLGSGTLVSIGSTRAILTADHVLEALPKTGYVGLIFPSRFDNSPQAAPRLPPKIPVDYLEKKRVGIGEREAEGPDIGLLVLPDSIISQYNIRFTKNFYNLAKRRTRVVENPWPIDSGIWALVGVPAEWTEDAGPEAGFARVMKGRGLIGLVGVNKEYERGGFDYLECVANYNAAYEGPSGFGGCSGGGLWHMRRGTKERGQIVIKGKDTLLSGVAFYQSDCVDDKRIIRCHGRRSIYQRVIDALSD